MIMKNKIFVAVMGVLASLLFFKYYTCYSTADNLISIFKNYMLTYDIDKKSVNFKDNIKEESFITGFETLAKKIDFFVQQNKPLILTMVGFPYKSSNIKDKVLISDIDAAEYYSLRYLQTFLDEIKKHYFPGAQLYIFTDGIVFCDIEKVSDDIVMMYEDSLKKLAQEMKDIVIITTRDLCPSKTPDEIREMICSMNPSAEEFNVMMSSDKKLQEDVDVLAQRMSFELELLSLTQDELIAIGRQETHRSMQLSNFLKQFRPVETITCSVHYQKNVEKKIGLKLSESCVTPWHGILVENGVNEKSTIMHLKDVEKSRYCRAYKNINGVELLYLKKI